MTDEEFKIIKKICADIGFTVHPANEFVGRVVTDTKEKDRCSFYWEEKEGFLEFIRQFGQHKYYEGANRWSW
jgi:hypothetical protein